MGSAPERMDRAVAAVEKLHGEVSLDAAILERRHAERLRCGPGCTACCVDGITVFEVEAERIRRRHADLLFDGRPHPPGACAFLDEGGACRIYGDRPYVCRTQGLPLRWTEIDLEGRGVEYRDICPLNDRAEAPLEALAPEDCWTLGPAEERLARIQDRFDAPAPRVSLRGLFRAE